MSTSTFIAVDLGATSGRVMLGSVSPDAVTLDEIHRFATRALRMPDGLHWDVAHLLVEVVAGIRAAVSGGASPSGIGFDAWGVDYALLTRGGSILGLPFHHRDARTANRAASLDHDFLYRETGIQTLDMNTLVQLLVEPRDGALASADGLLFMPDLLAYLFCGLRVAERTIASTSQLLSWDGQPARAVTARFSLPHLLAPPVEPGTELGGVLKHMRNETGFGGPVFAVAGHDTASAVAAIPAVDDDFAFISLGTWGLVGFELRAPVLTDAGRKAHFTNEHGVDGTYRYLRNVSGLWLLNESLRGWHMPPAKAAELVAVAADCPRYRSLIDPLDPVFSAPGDMPGRIAAYCRRTGQPAPEDPAQYTRCIVDSLALSFTDAIEVGAATSGVQPATIHIVGGGSQIEDLNQAVADLTGIRVIAGPVEATAFGNVLIQASGSGSVRSLRHLRAIVAASTRTRRFAPTAHPAGPAARRRFAQLVQSTTDCYDSR